MIWIPTSRSKDGSSRLTNRAWRWWLVSEIEPPVTRQPCCLAALLPPNHRFLSFGFLLSSLVWEWPPFWFHRGHCWPYLVLMSQSFSAVALAFETFLNSVTEKKGKSRRPWTCFGLAGSLMHHLSPIRKLHKCNQWELETNQRKKRENFLSGAEEPSLKSSKPLKRKLTCDLYLSLHAWSYPNKN